MALANRIREMWARGEVPLSAIVTIPSVQVVQIMSRGGLDALTIDMEHGAIDVKTAHTMIAATAGTPVVPFVRIPWNLPWLAKGALDAGALGITFPMVRTRQEAEAAVAAVRYPPRGGRLWGPFYAPLRWDVSMADYLAQADDQVIAAVLIEDAEAVRNIADIVATPGLDLVMIGAQDLATSLGVRGQPEHPSVQAAVAEVERAVLPTAVPLGTAARNPAQARELIGRGYKYLGVGFDWMLLGRGVAAACDGIR